MLKTFDCPKCGAPVSYQQDVIGANLTARCSYCNSSLSVPDEMRGRPAQVINIDFKATGEAGAKVSKSVLVIVIVVVVGVIVAVLAITGALVTMTSGIKSVAVTPPGTRPGVKSAAKGDNDFATTSLKFGSEGIGAGKFKDARAIAVDASGKIYVGEYSGGRIQVFDSQGKFLTQWSVDPKMPLTGMAADRNGTVYTVQSGVISRRDGSSGQVLSEVPYAPGWGFDDIVVAANGDLVTAWYKNRDDIVRLNALGQVSQTIRAAISSVTDQSELDTHVAVDGLGNIYALGTFNSAVFKFSPEGKYLTRFGDSGDEPGQFRAPSAIAVDGLGRVYVSDFKGVQVFDGNGRYVTTFKPDGTAWGMVFNDKDELFVAARDHVLKLTVKKL